jgi:hypothetical protein
MVVSVFRAIPALRIRVSMSLMGSFTLMRRVLRTVLVVESQGWLPAGLGDARQATH